MKIEEATRMNRALNKLGKLYWAAKARKLAKLGLHPGQDVLLWVLAQDEGGMMVSELAGRLGIESPTVTRSLVRMEKLDLFQRVAVPTDRRQVRIILSPEGRNLIVAIEQIWSELAEETFGPLPSEVRNLVVEALEAANERLRDQVEDSDRVLAGDLQ